MVSVARPKGFEPLTFGSVERGSTACESRRSPPREESFATRIAPGSRRVESVSRLGLSVMMRAVETGGDEWWELRDAWSCAFALLGAYGYRPKLMPDALVCYRADGSAFTLTVADEELPARRYDSTLCLTLTSRDAAVLVEERFPFDSDDELMRTVLGVLSNYPDQPHGDTGFIRHFPPASELDRIRLAAAYGSYRPYLDALASLGIHAYLELTDLGSLRMYSDISPKLLLDISVDDEGLDELGPADGEWVVFLTGPGGHEAEFTVDRLDDGDSGPELLAEAVSGALGDVLRGKHLFFEHYDPRYGRLDPRWLTRADP